MVLVDRADDYVIATGKTHSVRELCEVAFERAGIDLSWQGSGADEIAVDGSGNTLVELAKEFLRPAEVDLLIGDATKARDELGWEPKTSFRELVCMMVDADLADLTNGER